MKTLRTLTAATPTDAPAAHSYEQQVQQDWGTSINDYFPGGYINPNSSL